MPDIIGCAIKRLPDHKLIPAAENAVRINPANYPNRFALAALVGRSPTPLEIAFTTTQWWGSQGKDFTVSFLDNPDQATRKLILQHANLWSKTAQVSFRESNTDPDIRITRTSGDGYWSYVGTDLQHVDPNEPTMNLDSFTSSTDLSEYMRVVPHEFAHSLGAIHEHVRRQIVVKIVPRKAYVYFGATQGWSHAEVDAQVLTPQEDSTILFGTPDAEEDSIMCYPLPGSIMVDGIAVPGGTHITDHDYEVMGIMYPRVTV